MSLDVFEGNDGRLLHDVAQVARERQLGTLTFRQGGLDEENLTADAGPRQSGDNTGIAVALIDVAVEGGLAQQVLDFRRRNLFVGQFAFLCLLIGHLAQGLVDLLLQLAHAAFTSVLLDNLLDGSFVERQFLVHQSRILLFLGNEVALGNLEFLFRDIAADLNDFHTVE